MLQSTVMRSSRKCACNFHCVPTADLGYMFCTFAKRQQCVCVYSSQPLTCNASASELTCQPLQVLVPPLRELEAYIFERLFRYLWQKALLESVSREPSGGPAMFSPHMMTPTHKASQHEDAIQRWLDALQVQLSLVICPGLTLS